MLGGDLRALGPWLSRLCPAQSLMLAKAKECWEQEHEEREAEKARYLAERIPTLQTRGLSLSALQVSLRGCHQGPGVGVGGGGEQELVLTSGSSPSQGPWRRCWGIPFHKGRKGAPGLVRPSPSKSVFNVCKTPITVQVPPTVEKRDWKEMHRNVTNGHLPLEASLVACILFFLFSA